MEPVLRTALEQNTLDCLADLLRDKLAGQNNGDGFTILGTRSIETTRRAGGTIFLLRALLKKLPSLRDELGSGVAEQVVCETADLLASCFRRSDSLARRRDAQFSALTVDAAEPSAPVFRLRVESRLAMHNQGRQPWDPLALRVSVGFWGANDARSSPKFLDAVEAELRRPEMALGERGSRVDGGLGCR